jgi:PAS domain S-box-containing protein
MLKTLFESSSDACLLMENNLIINCNQAAVAMLHADSKDQMINIHPSEISPAIQPDGSNSYEKAEELLAQATAIGSLRFEWMHNRRHGEPFYVDVSLTLLRDNGRNIIYKVWRDIADLKDSENRLRLMTMALNHSGEAIIITGSDNKIIAVNSTFSRLTGYSAVDALGQDPRFLKSGNEPKEFPD